MRSRLLLIVLMFFLFSAGLYSQHTVGDVRQYGGWYNVRFEFRSNDNVSVYVTQVYPSGIEFEVIGDEREGLPLYLKIICLGLIDEFYGFFSFDEMTFEEDGFFMKLANFSLSFIFDFTMDEKDVLQDLGDDMINRFRDARWP